MITGRSVARSSCATSAHRAQSVKRGKCDERGRNEWKRTLKAEIVSLYFMQFHEEKITHDPNVKNIIMKEGSSQNEQGLFQKEKGGWKVTWFGDDDDDEEEQHVIKRAGSSFLLLSWKIEERRKWRKKKNVRKEGREKERSSWKQKRKRERRGEERGGNRKPSGFLPSLLPFKLVVHVLSVFLYVLFAHTLTEFSFSQSVRESRSVNNHRARSDQANGNIRQGRFQKANFWPPFDVITGFEGKHPSSQPPPSPSPPWTQLRVGDVEQRIESRRPVLPSHQMFLWNWMWRFDWGSIEPFFPGSGQIQRRQSRSSTGFSLDRDVS